MEINSVPPAANANFLHVRHLRAPESVLWGLNTLMSPTHPCCSITLVNPAQALPPWTLLTPSIQILYFKLIPADANWNHLLCHEQDIPIKYILSHSSAGITARECRLVLSFEAEDEANLLEITQCWVLHTTVFISLAPTLTSGKSEKKAVGTNLLSWDRQDRKGKINKICIISYFGMGKQEQQLPQA